MEHMWDSNTIVRFEQPAIAENTVPTTEYYHLSLDETTSETRSSTPPPDYLSHEFSEPLPLYEAALIDDASWETVSDTTETRRSRLIDQHCVSW